MRVRRTLPQRERSLIGPWCFCDHYGPDDVAVTGGMHVPPHPHTGLQTVTWLFAGRVEHRDSMGSTQIVRPGELSLMTAGHGISHSEQTPTGLRSPVLHGVQLWAALPAGRRDGPPAFEHHSALPFVEAGDWRVQVFLGSVRVGADELRSPATAYTPAVGAQIDLESGAVVVLTVDPEFEHGVLVDEGTVRVSADPMTASRSPVRDDAARPQGVQVPTASLAYIPPGSSAVTLTAEGEGPARLVFLGGGPFGEQIVMWWNFVGRSHDEVAAARADWAQEVEVSSGDGPNHGGTHYAPGADAGRFGTVAGYPGGPLPAPVLPPVRLRPRG